MRAIKIWKNDSALSFLMWGIKNWCEVLKIDVRYKKLEKRQCTVVFYGSNENLEKRQCTVVFYGSNKNLEKRQCTVVFMGAMKISKRFGKTTVHCRFLCEQWKFGKTIVHCRFLWEQWKFRKDLEKRQCTVVFYGSNKNLEKIWKNDSALSFFMGALNFWKNANFRKKANGRAAIKIWKKKIQHVYILGYGNARLQIIAQYGRNLIRNMIYTKFNS